MTEPAVKPCILLVDDDPRALLAMEGSLQSDDYDIITASSGAQALSRLKESSDFAFALLDVRMPGMDGFALARAIKAQDQFAQLPLCFLTASRDERDQALYALKLGAVDFLSKPPDLELLSLKIPVYIDLWKNRQNLIAANLRLLSLNVALETERQKIKFSEERLRHIIDATPNGLVQVDQSGKIVLVNTQMEKLFGYTQAEMFGQPIEILLPERLRGAHPGHREGFMKSPQPRGMGAGSDLFGRRKDGSEFPVEIGLNPIETPEGPRVIASVIDITERKKLDQMKTEFISTVSHELRTPLTSINGALGLVCAGTLGEVSPKVQSMLNLAYQNSKRLTLLINDLLDIEKLSAGKMLLELKRQLLRPQVELSLQDIEGFAQKYQVKLVLQPGCDDVEVTVDALRLQQVIGNLLSNAIKYSPIGGQVELVLGVKERTDLTTWVRVDIIDQGPGISPEFASRIFQKFAQDDSSNTRSKGGTGLGLAISKSLAQAMHGELGYHTIPGSGSHFYLDFPVVQSSSAAAAAAARKMPKHGQRSILVVEDDAETALLLSLFLTRAGYATDEVRSTQEALDKLDSQHFDLMTIDMRLPDRSGLDLLRDIRTKASLKNLPVIMISGFVEDKQLAIATEFQALDWLEKPIDRKRLLDLIQNHLSLAPPNKPKILHVEDDPDLLTVIAALGSGLADFSAAANLKEARSALAKNSFDLVILDIGLPDGSGWDLLPQIQALAHRPLVAVLSGQDWSVEQRQQVDLAYLKSRTSNQSLLDSLEQALSRSSIPTREAAP